MAIEVKPWDELKQIRKILTSLYAERDGSGNAIIIRCPNHTITIKTTIIYPESYEYANKRLNQFFDCVKRFVAMQMQNPCLEYIQSGIRYLDRETKSFPTLDKFNDFYGAVCLNVKPTETPRIVDLGGNKIDLNKCGGRAAVKEALEVGYDRDFVDLLYFIDTRFQILEGSVKMPKDQYAKDFILSMETVAEENYIRRMKEEASLTDEVPIVTKTDPNGDGK
ncbi:MAG: hypothetical protein IJ817_01240 [Clostridia bacterium]|nr:hypothetical protein [Clostridia bacterium]